MIKRQGCAVKIACAAMVCSAAMAQTGAVGGPVLGFVFDGSARALRPVLGIPGASTLGDPVTLSFDASSATVAPRQDSAIAMAPDGSVHLLGIKGGGVAEVQCAACPATAETAVYSPSGSAVALYAGGQVRIVTGLPAAPAAGASFEVGGVRGRVAAPALALSDDGRWLLASTGNAVNLYSANAGQRTLLATKPNALVAFAAGGHDAAIADAEAGIVLLHDVTGGATQQQVAAPGAIRRASALAFSADGSRLLAASLAEQTVTSMDVVSGSSTSAVCGCAPSSLVTMGGMLRLNELGSGPLWLVDANLRLVFVPAAAATAN